MPKLLRRVRRWLQWGRLEAELSEEIEHHRELKQRELERRGLSPVDAAVEARRALGNMLTARERSRDVWIWPSLGDVGQDVRFAGRLLVRDRWFTLATATILALGIGANATVFTIISAMAFQDLPVDEPERILSLQMRDERGQRLNVSYLDLRDWQQATRAFTGLAGFNELTINVSDEGRAPDQQSGAFVGANTFALLRVRPALGRDFLPDDDRPGAPPVVILGHGLWTSRYGADRSILGRTIRVNATPATVVGVMPQGFKFPFQAELWQPLAARPGVTAQPRDARGIGVFGRLADGIVRDQARTEMQMIASRLADQYPDTNTGITPVMTTFNERYNGRPTEGIPLILMGAVGFVLLIACANVSSLFLARSGHRAREIGIRVSLGATRWRIVRQVLVESVLLAVIAAALGFWVSVLGVRAFRSAVDDLMLPFWVRFAIDARVFAFLAAVCVGTGILFGLAPALHVSKTNPQEALKDGSGGRTNSRVHRWTSALLVPELALTLVLLAGAGFLIRGAMTLYRADLVIDPSNLLTMRLTLPQKYATPELRTAFGQRLEERLAAIPPISSATIASALPFAGAGRQQLSIDGRHAPAADRPPVVLTVAIGSRYFETLGLRVRRGRPFSGSDGAPGYDAALVNERFVAVHLAGDDPIGKRIRLTDETPSTDGAPWLTIVGVAPTVRQRPFTEAEPVVYLPFRSRPSAFVALIVRAAAEPQAVATLVREEVRALDPDLPVYGIMPMAGLSEMSRWGIRIVSTMLSIFAGIAMVLSATGLYAIIAYAVTQRTREIGVRMALGAMPYDVMWLFMRRAVVPLALGIAIGFGGALAVGKVLRSAFIDASGTDPLTLVSLVALLVAVAVVACVVPARRATRLDPVTALRHE
jgi:putative ABC transport system permease protein